MNSDITVAVQNWLARAVEDWEAVEMLVKYSECPRNVVCFHCQQNVEKLLKALLTLHEIEFPKTHSLSLLIESAVRFLPELSELLDESDILTNYALASRYPDDFYKASKSDMVKVIETTNKFHDLLNPIFKDIN